MKIIHQKLPGRMLMRLSRSRIPFKIVLDNEYHPMNGLPIIFAANHTNSYDIPISINAVCKPLCVLLGKQRLGFADRFFFFLNGMIYVDRMDRTETRQSKDAMIKLLRSGRSILWFPEGTWNMTDNLLMLPMKWGIIEVARTAGAQIIPLALEYDRENMICTVRFGAPIFGTALDNKAEAIGDLRDAMATLRWELISRAPPQDRGTLDIPKLRASMWQAVEEYPPIEWEKEERVIFHPYKDVDVVPKRLRPSRANAFLFRKTEWREHDE